MNSFINLFVFLSNKQRLKENKRVQLKYTLTTVSPLKLRDDTYLYRESDIMLLGALTTLSACFPKLYGIYDGKKVVANLYLFVTAPASAGKGRLTQCKNLVTPIHKAMREQATVLKKQFDAENAVCNWNKGKNENLEKPGKPPKRIVIQVIK